MGDLMSRSLCETDRSARELERHLRSNPEKPVPVLFSVFYGDPRTVPTSNYFADRKVQVHLCIPHKNVRVQTSDILSRINFVSVIRCNE